MISEMRPHNNRKQKHVRQAKSKHGDGDGGGDAKKHVQQLWVEKKSGVGPRYVSMASLDNRVWGTEKSLIRWPDAAQVWKQWRPPPSNSFLWPTNGMSKSEEALDHVRNAILYESLPVYPTQIQEHDLAQKKDLLQKTDLLQRNRQLELALHKERKKVAKLAAQLAQKLATPPPQAVTTQTAAFYPAYTHILYPQNMFYAFQPTTPVLS
jgi:hypothetical protein